MWIKAPNAHGGVANACAQAQLQTEVATKAGGAGGAGAAKAIPWTTLMKRPRLTRDDRISRIRWAAAPKLLAACGDSWPLPGGGGG